MSAPDISCYDYIIGLYNGNCDCYDPKTTDYNLSDSGLYISDLLEPKFIDGLLNCDNGASIWELMEIVRELAVRYFIADANALLIKSNKLKRFPYIGGVGTSTYTKDMQLAPANYAGVRLISPLIKSGYLKIDKIGLIMNATTPVTVNVYDRTGTLLHALNLSATANTHTLNAVDIELPLRDDYLDYMEYWFVYQPSGFLPKNNGVFSCSSCMKSKPGWMSWVYNPKAPWAAWISAGGFKSVGLPDFNTSIAGSDYMYGMTFHVELGCKINEVLCKDSMNFQSNPMAQAMAIAIQRKAAALFIDRILTTQNLNRAVMIDREQLAKSKDEWLTSYEDMIAYIAEQTDISANDCLECRDVIEMIQGGIFA
jgi:hypothetical protein